MNDSEWSNICLVFNALMWLSTFTIYQLRTRYFGVGSGILLMYTIMSIGAIHLYNNNNSSDDYENITLFPFIYLFVMILMAIYPIMSIQESKIRCIQAPNLSLLKIVSIGIIVLAIIGLPRAINLIQENMFALVMEDDAGMELYTEKNAEGATSQTSSQFNIMGMLSNICGNISLVFFLYYLTLEKKSKMIMIGLGLTSLVGPLGDLANGGRAVIAVYVLNTLFMLLFIRRFLNESFKKKLLRIVSIMLVLIMFPFLTLTMSRNQGDAKETLSSIESYGTQGFLVFNNYGLDAGGTRNGDYTAVAFKKIMGLNPAMYYAGRLKKYSHMKLNESNFYTFVGDFTLDYGPFWAVIIFIITAIFFKHCLKIRNGCLKFHQYLMFYLLMVGCLGFFQFPLGRESGNLQMIAILILAVLFKFYDAKNQRKQRVNFT